ncbi:MAG: hypothetical protein ACRDL5_19360, partial [Solirubrobacteraceae bacterium]
PLARAARLARTRAEPAVARSLTEPATRRIDADISAATLDATRRMVQSVHVLRLDAADLDAKLPRRELEPFAGALDQLLSIVERALRARADGTLERPTRSLPDVRGAYLTLSGEHGQESSPLLGDLDELVDAANGLAAATGLEIDAADHSD